MKFRGINQSTYLFTEFQPIRYFIEPKPRLITKRIVHQHIRARRTIYRAEREIQRETAPSQMPNHSGEVKIGVLN